MRRLAKKLTGQEPAPLGSTRSTFGPLLPELRTQIGTDPQLAATRALPLLRDMPSYPSGAGLGRDPLRNCGASAPTRYCETNGLGRSKKWWPHFTACACWARSPAWRRTQEAGTCHDDQLGIDDNGPLLTPEERPRVTSCGRDLASSPYEARAGANARPVRYSHKAFHVPVLQRSARSMSGLATTFFAAGAGGLYAFVTS